MTVLQEHHQSNDQRDARVNESAAAEKVFLGRAIGITITRFTRYIGYGTPIERPRGIVGSHLETAEQRTRIEIRPVVLTRTVRSPADRKCLITGECAETRCTVHTVSR